MGASNEDADRVLTRAMTIASNRDRAKQWLDEPLPTFGGKTPLDLVAAGRTQEVLDYLDTIASGFLG
jgi:uncharacterized protein (DUF2384 family)